MTRTPHPVLCSYNWHSLHDVMTCVADRSLERDPGGSIRACRALHDRLIGRGRATAGAQNMSLGWEGRPVLQPEKITVSSWEEAVLDDQ